MNKKKITELTIVLSFDSPKDKKERNEDVFLIEVFRLSMLKVVQSLLEKKGIDTAIQFFEKENKIEVSLMADKEKLVNHIKTLKELAILEGLKNEIIN